MYFSFLSFYTLWLTVPALVGIPLFFVQTFVTNFWVLAISNSIFGFMMVAWCALFFEAWKRREIHFSVSWGQTDFEEEEVERSEFKGLIRRSPVDDLKERFFHSSDKLYRITITTLINLGMLAIIVGVIIGIIGLRILLYELWKNSSTFWVYMALIIPSIVNSIQIMIFNVIYSNIAYHLTNYENHKTQTAYEKALIVKTFTFQFVNSFNMLFYLAFFKSPIQGCIASRNGSVVLSEFNLCTSEVSNQMRSIMIIAIFKNIAEIAIPCITNIIKVGKKSRLFDTNNLHFEKDKLIARIERELTLGNYTYKEIDGTYYDYLEIML